MENEVKENSTEVKILKQQLERAHTIIMCLIAFLVMIALLIFVYFYNSDIEMTKEIITLQSDGNGGDAIYQHGNNNNIGRDTK